MTDDQNTQEMQKNGMPALPLGRLPLSGPIKVVRVAHAVIAAWGEGPTPGAGWNTLTNHFYQGWCEEFLSRLGEQESIILTNTCTEGLPEDAYFVCGLPGGFLTRVPIGRDYLDLIFACPSWRFVSPWEEVPMTTPTYRQSWRPRGPKPLEGRSVQEALEVAESAWKSDA